MIGVQYFNLRGSFSYPLIMHYEPILENGKLVLKVVEFFGRRIFPAKTWSLNLLKEKMCQFLGKKILWCFSFRSAVAYMSSLTQIHNYFSKLKEKRNGVDFTGCSKHRLGEDFNLISDAM